MDKQEFLQKREKSSKFNVDLHLLLIYSAGGVRIIQMLIAAIIA